MQSGRFTQKVKGKMNSCLKVPIVSNFLFVACLTKGEISEQVNCSSFTSTQDWHSSKYNQCSKVVFGNHRYQ